MIQVLVRITVEDQAKWKSVFEEAGSLRKGFGSMGVRAFAKTDNSNEIVIIGEYSDLEKAMQMFKSQEFREATARGGVKGTPEVSFLNELLQLPA
jgi:heme-degrading monooxygenase HmoA